MALISLWGRHAKSPRLATPALRTAEVLLSRTQMLSSADDQSDLLGNAATSGMPVAASLLMHRHTRNVFQCL